MVRHGLTGRSPEQLVSSEKGAILPIFALMLVVLLGFAALAVDLGAAWSQRTLNQTAADGGVMAGGIGFIGETPLTNEEIVAEVERYVDLNLGYSVPAADWAACLDPEVANGNFHALIDGDDNVINPCVSLSAELTSTGERIFRVLLPTQQVETSFARLLGIDQIATSAFAEADLHFGKGGGALPFVMPADAESQYCMGDMPPGLAQAPCDGSNTGKRNDIISPWHGTTDYPGTPACTGDNNNPLVDNIALGLDHTVREADGDDLDPAWAPSDGADNCAARDTGIEPYALKIGEGGSSLIEGFAGNSGSFGTVANLPGRLRQGGGLNDGVPVTEDGHVSNVALGSGDDARLVDGAASNPSNMWLDNVGLWEYFFDGGDSGNCLDFDFAGYALDGSTATEALESCLLGMGPIGEDEQLFTDALLTSPRFALVPRLHADKARLDSMPPNTFTNIQDFIPVYIQSTFWNCNANDTPVYDEFGDPVLDPISGDPLTSEGSCELRFRTYEDELAEGDDTTNILTNDRMWFAPGEGNAPTCLLQGPISNEKCKNNGLVDLDGVTVILLDPTWVPPEIFEGGATSDVPLFIQLSG